MGGKAFMQQISEMLELIEYELSTDKGPESKLMCARGLLMLLHIESLSDFDWQPAAQDII